MIFRYLSPDFYIDEIRKIRPEELEKWGVKGVICDLDNTIIPWGEETLSEEIIEWIACLKAAGYRLCLVSNSLHTRVNGIAAILDVDAVPAAAKPRKKAFLKAIAKLQLDPTAVVVIGDQLFTDIFGGKRLGLKTVLVKPMSSEELLWTRMMRKLEKKILHRTSK